MHEGTKSGLFMMNSKSDEDMHNFGEFLTKNNNQRYATKTLMIDDKRVKL